MHTISWILSPPNLYVVAITMWLYLEIGPLWKELRLNEVIRVGPLSDRISIFLRRDTRELFSPSLSLSLSLPRKDTAKRQCLQSQEETFHLNPTMLAYWCWISSLQNCEKTHFCCLNHPVYGILLWLKFTEKMHIDHKYHRFWIQWASLIRLFLIIMNKEYTKVFIVFFKHDLFR